MKTLRKSLAAPALFALCAFGVLGCADEPTGPVVTGKVVFPADVSLDSGDSVGLYFFALDPANGNGVASVSPESRTFIVTEAGAGISGRPMRPGKYLIILQIARYKIPMTEDLNKLNARFHNNNSGLEYEITTLPAQSITVDLVEGKVKVDE